MKVIKELWCKWWPKYSESIDPQPSPYFLQVTMDAFEAGFGAGFIHGITK